MRGSGSVYEGGYPPAVTLTLTRSQSDHSGPEPIRSNHTIMVAVSPFVSYTAVGCRPASLSVCSSHDKAFFYLPVDIQHISVSVTTFHPQEIDPLCGNQTG